MGKTLAETSSEIVTVIEQSIEVLKTTNNKCNPNFIAGMLEVLKSKDPEAWERIIQHVSQSEELIIYYVGLIRFCSPELKYLDILISFIELGKLPIDIIGALTWLEHLQPNEIGKFTDKLCRIQPEGSWFALELLYMYYNINNTLWDSISHYIKNVVGQIRLPNKGKYGNFNLFSWKELVKELLDTYYGQFAEEITLQILKDMKENHFYGSSADYIQEIFIKAH